MKTKISVIAAVLLLAITATAISANFRGATTTAASPVQGDPVPGVDVSIEQSPSGIMAGETSTDGNGNVKMNMGPGNYLLTINPFSPSSKTFRSNKSQKVVLMIKVGETTVLDTWDFSGRCLYTKKVDVPPGPARTVEVTVVEGKPCEPTPTPR